MTKVHGDKNKIVLKNVKTEDRERYSSTKPSKEERSYEETKSGLKVRDL